MSGVSGRSGPVFAYPHRSRPQPAGSRNSTELRLDRKCGKRDLDFNLREADRDHVMNTDETTRVRAQDLIEQQGHLRIGNTRLAATETAALIQRWMPQ
ncbi:hypothetical protein BS329_16065 [Amycolatopsis coloradensis]|uniref:Uncharacterized protein n=1 Tax=Amycolatopsis coloradensis TaxID=76021 RepID=A0A1R0KTF0_9PSEU|nr:hypothetical protein BS329_16065 [Amycolatopsis coloradensis]